ncbi:MAG TPA: acetate--CoA ligase [Holophagaceae bacterium]|nr:acetate--CoA ligase [Holophagaceae bacterium]
MAELDSLGAESRRFPPPPAFAARANLGAAMDEALRAAFAEDWEGTWAKLGRDELRWSKPFGQAFGGTFEHPRWFGDGELNASVQCLDRWLGTATEHKAALIWEGEPGDQRTLTYGQLHREVARTANALRALGVRKGDRVALYMPLIPELAIAVLACARLGAPHTVVFGGFSAEALAGRIQDAGAEVLLTADGGWRKGELLKIKEIADAAASQCPALRKVVVARRTGHDIPMQAGRDIYLDELLAAHGEARAEPEACGAEDTLFLLYTSGSTGKPKGIVHTTAGYLLWAKLTARWVLDLKPEDLYWCTADIGWITGHSYVIYGPLQLGATVLMYEGNPLHPAPDRFWSIVERHRVSVFYTAPTAIRTFIRLGDGHVLKHDLSSLRLLGTVGEPINPEAWLWYHHTVGGARCPIVDTWWQTETGGMMIAPLPGAQTTTPGSATRPLPGVMADIVDKEGGPKDAGLLVMRRSWPGQLRGIWGNPERYHAGYFAEVPGCYLAGDGARKDEDGNIWIMGRVDDVLNVSGHRLGTAEVESALVAHPDVAEAAVVGRPDELKGEAIVAFVTLKSGRVADAAALKAHVTKEIGALARPDEIRFAEALPKTRSGKIMRRLLRDLARGTHGSQDTSTLEDQKVMDRLREAAPEEE